MHAVLIDDDDFESGGLRQVSYVRPNRLLTADQRIILYAAGHLKRPKTREIVARIVDILQR